MSTYFFLTSLVAELLAISLLFNKEKFQNISLTLAANWWQNVAADLSLWATTYIITVFKLAGYKRYNLFWLQSSDTK